MWRVMVVFVQVVLLGAINGLFPTTVWAGGEGQTEHQKESEINSVWHQAKLRGVAFRAIGQEPGWLLEITEGKSILLVTDYGQNKLEQDYVEPVIDQEARRTEYQLSDVLKVVLTGQTCSDVMSGEIFATSVNVMMPGRILKGCGRALY